MSLSTKHFYEFGAFRIDLAERVLLRDGRPVPLPAKTFETLLALVERSGHIVEKDELMERIWPDTFIEEGNLARHVSNLRKVLGEDATGQPYIETVPRRGYRFVAPVKEGAPVSALSVDEADELVVETHTLSRIVTQEEVEPVAIETRPEPPALLAESHTALAPSGGTSLVVKGKRHRRLVWGLVLAGVIVVAAAAFFFNSRRSSPLTEKDTILLADFANTTGEAVFDQALKQGLAVQLEQSPFLNIFPEASARETLRMMNRAADEPITPSLAREICRRQGIKAALSGAIAPVGSHYVMTLEATNAQTGEVIARDQVEAESREQVLQALSRAAKNLREKLGESLGSIKKFHAPIEQATTSSLEALQTYSLGREQVMRGDVTSAIRLYRRAVELDPNFAIAWNALADLQRFSDPAAALECITKAYALRDPTSEVERLRITLTWHEQVTQDQDRLIEESELWKRNYPHSWRPYWSLALHYYEIGQNEKALEHAQELRRLNPHAADHYVLTAKILIRLNRLSEAAEMCRQALEMNYLWAEPHHLLYQIAKASGDAAGMQQQLDWANASGFDDLSALWQVEAAIRAGQWRRTQQLSRTDTDTELAVPHNASNRPAFLTSHLIVAGALFGDCRTALNQDERGLASSQRLEWLTGVAIAHAQCGETAQAEGFIEQYQTRYPKATLLQGLYLPAVRAALALRQGEPDRALEDLQPTRRFEGVHSFWPAWLRAQAYLRQRNGAQAAAEFQQMIEHRNWYLESPWHPLAYLGRARALALGGGEVAKSQEAYRDFFALWKDADPNLPVLIEAKREYERLQ